MNCYDLRGGRFIEGVLMSEQRCQEVNRNAFYDLSRSFKKLKPLCKITPEKNPDEYAYFVHF